MTNFLDISHTRTLLLLHSFLVPSILLSFLSLHHFNTHSLSLILLHHKKSNTNGKHKRPTSILLKLRRRRCIAGAQEEREPPQPGVGRLRSCHSSLEPTVQGWKHPW